MENHCALELHHLQYFHSLYLYGYRLLSSITPLLTSAQQLWTLGAIGGVRAISRTISGAAFVVTNLLLLLTRLVVGLTAAKAAYGLLSIVLLIAWQVYYPLRVTLRHLSQLSWFGGCVFEVTPLQHVTTQERYVALTLNCGPSPYSTDAILAVLDKYDARATFFVSGSQVDKCDAIGAGSGVEGLGKAILAKMFTEGHQLGALTKPAGWQACPTQSPTHTQLLQELSDCSKLIAAIQRQHAQHAVTVTGPAHGPASGTAVLNPKTGPCKWFRPQFGLSAPGVIKAAKKLGYTAVLASVFPWDNIIKWPYWNALNVRSKVYAGAVIMLNDGPQLLPTLQHILPWLQSSGYKIVTLDTAAAMSQTAESLGELTCNTLEAHNRSFSLRSNSSRSGDADVLIAAGVGSAGSPTQGQSLSGSGSPLEAPDAQSEESEKLRLKAVKRAEADKRAGIDRQLASMSAAERRAAERKERERKEAEKRRARRAAEENKAQQRYEEYIRRKAQQEILLEQEKAEAIDAWRQQSLDQFSTEIQEMQPAETTEQV